MSAEITTVEFHRPALPSETYLDELGDDGPPYTISGVALGAGDITKGKSGIKKKWPAEELRKAADTLQGTNLVIDHQNNARGVVGKVTKAGYKEGRGVVYEAELYDEDLAENIKNGLLEVSVRGLHADVESLSRDEETGAIEVEDITFENLSIVSSGAAPSNTLEMGEHAELSEAELSSFMEELAKIEPGDWVTWDDKHGIVMSQIEDGEAKVDVYEKVDDKWRAIGKTVTVSVSEMSKWDVSEDNIGPRKEEDEDSKDEEENADTDVDEELGTHKGAVEKGDWVSFDDFDGNKVYGRVIGIQQEEGRRIAKITLWQESDDGWMKVEETVERPSAVLDSWEDHPEPNGEEEASAVERGQFVKWRDVDSSCRYGQIIDIDQVGAQIVATLQRFTEAGDRLDETERKPVQGLDRWDWSPSTRKSNESTVSQSEPSESNSDVGVGEVVNFLSKFVEENASTTKDVPTDEAQPSHEPMGDDEPRIGEMTIREFVERLRSVDELERPEGAEEKLDDPKAIREMMENSPERFLPGEEEELSEDDSTDEGEAEELEGKFDGYPEAAQENAQMALDAREETGNPNDCGTEVGWKRAKQLANGEALTREQLGKMSAFARHQQNSEMDDDEGRADCGWMMWKAWGGDEGIEWAQRRLDEIQEEASTNEGESNSETMTIESSNVRAEAELQDYSFHRPEYSGTTTQDWDEPALEDFLSAMDADAESWDDLTQEQKEEIGQHFLISASGFPAENFSDMKLPVVEPSGELNVNALAAVKGGHGAGAVEGLSDEMESKINSLMNELANEEFDRSWGEEENSANKQAVEMAGNSISGDEGMELALGFAYDYVFGEGNSSQKNTVADFLNWLQSEKASGAGSDVVNAVDDAVEAFMQTAEQDSRDSVPLESLMDWAREQGAEPMSPEELQAVSGSKMDDSSAASLEMAAGVRVLPGDDLQNGGIGESEQDSFNYKVTNMKQNIQEKLDELDEPVAVEAEELSTLQDKADRFEELSENIEALKERTEILDEVDREAVEELRDSDDPVVVESTRYEELTSEAEQVKGVYAESLAEEMPGFEADELTDRYSIEELREKHEEVVGSVEEELAPSSEEAEPRSTDPSEEELEEAAESHEDKEAEELEEKAEQKRQEIREKIFSN